MKALSIKEPFATLILSGLKNKEHRTRNTKYRGWFIIHTSKKADEDVLIQYGFDLTKMRNGCLVGVAYLHDTSKNLKCNTWAWHISMIETFKKPIPYKGKLGFFEVENKILKKIPEICELYEREKL